MRSLVVCFAAASLVLFLPASGIAGGKGGEVEAGRDKDTNCLEARARGENARLRPVIEQLIKEMHLPETSWELLRRAVEEVYRDSTPEQIRILLGQPRQIAADVLPTLKTISGGNDIGLNRYFARPLDSTTADELRVVVTNDSPPLDPAARPTRLTDQFVRALTSTERPSRADTTQPVERNPQPKPQQGSEVTPNPNDHESDAGPVKVIKAFRKQAPDVAIPDLVSVRPAI
jgi:hypothetical protein